MTFNISNITYNNTFIPLTTTQFETSFSYYTTNAIPNDTSTIDITLYFKYNNTIIQPDNALLMELTHTFKSVLNQTLIINYPQVNMDDILYLKPISDANNTNITNIDLYLEWSVILLIENDTNIITVLSRYLSSTQFIDDFNIYLDTNIKLIETYKLEINRRDRISTTDWDITTTIIMGKDEYKLSQHLREYLLLYVVLFCIISVTLLCFGCWFCTVKYFINTTDIVHEDTVKQNDNKKGKKLIKKDDKIENKSIYNEVYVNTSNVEVKKTTNKYDEIAIDNNDREYMMKAFDDDEALHQNWYKEDSDSKNSDEIQLIQSIRPNESLTLTQRLKVQNAFDED